MATVAPRGQNMTYRERVLDSVNVLTEGKSHKAVHLNAIRAHVGKKARASGLQLGKLATPYIRRAAGSCVEDGILLPVKDQPLKYRLAPSAVKRRHSDIDDSLPTASKRRKSMGPVLPVEPTDGRARPAGSDQTKEPKRTSLTLLQRILDAENIPTTPVREEHEDSFFSAPQDVHLNQRSEQEPSLVVDTSVSRDTIDSWDMSADFLGTEKNHVLDKSMWRSNSSGQLQEEPRERQVLQDEVQVPLLEDADITLFDQDEALTLGHLLGEARSKEVPPTHEGVISSLDGSWVLSSGPAAGGVSKTSSDPDACIASLWVEVEHLHEELRLHGGAIELLLTEVESSQRRLDIRDNDGLVQMEAFRLKLARSRATIVKQHDRITQCLQEIDRLKWNIEQKHRAEGVLERSIKDLHSRWVKAESAWNTERSIAHELSKKMRLKDSHIADLRKKVTCWRALHRTTGVRLKEAEGANAQCIQRIASLEQSEQRSKELHAKLSDAEYALVVTQTALVAKDKLLTASERAATSSALDLVLLQLELDEVEKRGQSMGLQAATSQEHLSDIESKNELLEADASSLRDALAKANQENATQAALINTLKEAITEANIEWFAYSLGRDSLDSTMERLGEGLQKADEVIGDRDTSLTSDMEVQRLL